MRSQKNCIGSTYTGAKAKNLNVYSLVSHFAKLTKQINYKRLIKHKCQKNVCALISATN